MIDIELFKFIFNLNNLVHKTAKSSKLNKYCTELCIFARLIDV